MRRITMAVSIVLAACGAFRAYDGKARSRAEVARLSVSKAKSEGKGVETQDGAFVTVLSAVYWASIVRVDGFDVGGRSTVEVLPGHHEVELEWRQHVPGDVSVRLTHFGPTLLSSEAEGRTVVTVYADAGKDYRLVWDNAPAVRVGDTWETIPDGMVAHFEEREERTARAP